MFDKEVRWFIRCDTCPDDRITGVRQAHSAPNKDAAKTLASSYYWEVRDDLHRCPDCVREGRTEVAS